MYPLCVVLAMGDPDDVRLLTRQDVGRGRRVARGVPPVQILRRELFPGLDLSVIEMSLSGCG